MVRHYQDSQGRSRVCGGADLKSSENYPKQFLGVKLTTPYKPRPGRPIERHGGKREPPQMVFCLLACAGLLLYLKGMRRDPKYFYNNPSSKSVCIGVGTMPQLLPVQGPALSLSTAFHLLSCPEVRGVFGKAEKPLLPRCQEGCKKKG